MVIYEVNLTIRYEIYLDYYAWLLEHVNQMLKLDGFLQVEIGEVETDDHTKQLRVSYSVLSRDHLDDYLTNHAGKMRLEGIEKFGDQVSASRRIILEPITL